MYERFTRIPSVIAQAMLIPACLLLVTAASPSPCDASSAESPHVRQDDEFQGIPATKKQVEDDATKTYFLIGPREDAKRPEQGWKVVVILPGGNGSGDFHPFCRRIHKNALPEDCVAIQLVAPIWYRGDDGVVWPTETNNPDKAPFTTESFIREAVKEVAGEMKIDQRSIIALGWSSSGPAVYADALAADSPVTGSFVAMSVFRPEWLGDLSKAKDHPFFLLHSPDDWIKFDEHAKRAETELKKVGAKVELQTYRGGHGWRDDPFGKIRSGIDWLAKQLGP